MKDLLICNICENEIDTSEEIFRRNGRRVHGACADGQEPPQSKEKTINEAGLKQKAMEAEENFTRSVITDIQLPFERILAITFQFFIAGLILSIPIWIIFMIAFS